MKKQCIGPDCDREATAKGMCPAHHRQDFLGKPLTPLRAYRTRPVAPEGFAFCLNCHTYKGLGEFYKLQGGHTRRYCKKCMTKDHWNNEKKRKART